MRKNFYSSGLETTHNYQKTTVLDWSVLNVQKSKSNRGHKTVVYFDVKY